MDPRYAEPLDNRDQSVPRSVGFGFVHFPTRGIYVNAAAITMIRPCNDAMHETFYGKARASTLSRVTLIGGAGSEEITIPGSAADVMAAVADALGSGVATPLHIAPREGISHMGQP
jgi:hypothetical protein